MAESFWDDEEVLGEVSKGGKGGFYRVSLCRKGSRYYVNLREWFVHSVSGELRPGKGGVAIPIEAADEVGKFLVAAAKTGR